MLSDNKNYYQITFENLGGLVMPVIIQFEYADGTKELERIPAEIWKLESEKVTKVFVKEKEVVSIELDPFLETADVDRSNNYFPKKQEINRFELFKSRRAKAENKMQKANRAKEMEKEVQRP